LCHYYPCPSYSTSSLPIPHAPYLEKPQVSSEAKIQQKLAEILVEIILFARMMEFLAEQWWYVQ
jgi:hypothetical protein